MREAAESPAAERVRFRRTLVRVLLVQAVTLALLWLVHARYHAG
jgi:hypothetical protein